MEAYLNQIVDYMLTQSWQIAVLTVAVAVAAFALKNRSAHIRYLLWLIVLAKCLVPPLFTIPLAILPRAEPSEPIVVSSTPEIVAPGHGVPDTAALQHLERTSVSIEATSAPIVTDRATRKTVREWLAIAWIVGAGVYLVMNLLRALRANLWLARKRQALSAKLQTDIEDLLCAYNFKRLPRIWLMDDISQPFVWGLLRGSIYLPNNFTGVRNLEHQRNILGHELSHIIRFDAAINLLQVVAQAIFWFHPFVWWANKKIRAEREKCCDEMAIARLNALPKDYSTAVLDILSANHKSTRPVPSLAVAGPVKNIEERIKTMLRPGKKFYKRPSLVAATIVLLLALLTVPTALVLTAQAGTKPEPEHEKKPSKLGTLEYIDHLTLEDLFSVTSVETSPDGKFAYAAAYSASALTVFRRDKETGYLEHVQTVSNEENLSSAVAARVSPDGHYVVCTAFRSNTVSLFDRDKLTGTLKMLDIVKQDERGGQGLTWVIDSAISPDSRFVYAIADRSAALTVFRITKEGKLELVETNIGEDQCFDGARGIAISPNGKSIYVSAKNPGTLVVLDRDAKTGKIKLKQIIKDEQGNVHGLAGAFSVTCSPDGKFVYTSAGRQGGDNAICVFKKMSDGTLSLVQEIFDGQEGVTGFIGGNELITSPDGESLYALGSRSNSVVVFRRNVETGELTYAQTFYDSEVAGKDGSASGIGISPDGEYVYVAGEFDNSILIFKRLTGTKKGPAEALHRAASSGDIARVKSLIASGVDVNKKAERGYTPLHWAVKTNRKDVAELLIGAGGNVNARTGLRGWMPLHIATLQSNKEVAETLIAKGADLDAQNHNNWQTPLLITQKTGDINFAKFLIAKGARIDTKDEWGCTPLHHAAMAGDTTFADLLIKRGANINEKTENGCTPLFFVIRLQDAQTIRWFISKGADVNAKNNRGRTPLDWAKRMYPDIVELLRKHGASE